MKLPLQCVQGREAQDINSLKMVCQMVMHAVGQSKGRMSRAGVERMGCAFNIFLKKGLAEKVTSEQRFEGAAYGYSFGIQVERTVSPEVQGLRVGVCSG